MPTYDPNALMTSALAVLVDKAGGEMTYTQTEYAAIRARRGDYVITAGVDKTGPGEPIIRVKIEPKAGGKMPVV